MNTADPLTFIVLMLMVGIVLIGIYFMLREIIADAILLADKKRAQERERNQRRNDR